MKVCVCGGGNIAHATAAVLAESGPVSVFTRRAAEWSDRISCFCGDGKVPRQGANVVTAGDDAAMVSEADVLIISIPRFAIDGFLASIDGRLHAGQSILFNPAPAGMEAIVERMGEKGVEVAGLQRVPNVARTISYGKSVWIAETRKVVKFAVSNRSSADKWVDFIESRFGCRATMLSSFLSFTFSNSNPLLHPPRLLELLDGGDGGVYGECPLFYADWGNWAAELYVCADVETRAAFAAYSKEAAESDYESALEHYDAGSPSELAANMRSIAALKKISAPWKRRDDGLWVPDFDSRYFTEDVPCGTKIIQRYAKEAGVPTPAIDYLVSEIERKTSQWK